jgi:hypothetical protein
VNADELTRRLGPRRPNPLPWLRCTDCGRWSDDEARRWRAVLAGDADIEDTLEVVFFCPDCAEREFGQWPAGRLLQAACTLRTNTTRSALISYTPFRSRIG